MTMTTRVKIMSALAVVATLTATILAASGSAAAGINKGGTPVKHKNNPIANTIHPIIHHAPLHGEGSSHNPIVRNCNGPDTLCRRP
jgi:hypothetical protein